MVDYDRYCIIEALKITKLFRRNKWWLIVNDMGFEMGGGVEEVDKMIDEAFRTGKLDLSGLKACALSYLN